MKKFLFLVSGDTFEDLEKGIKHAFNEFKKEIANENKRKDFDECKYLYANIENLGLLSQLKPKIKGS